jgi:lipid-A-disaccharide synthase
MKKRGTNVIYFAPPQLWAWGEGRVKELRNNTDKVICLFPFEEKFFRDLGINAIYLGNPLLDYIENERNSSSTILKSIPSNSKIITFMPGSRKEEIKNHLPLMMEIFKKLKDEIHDIYGLVIAEKKDYLPTVDRLYFTKEGKYYIMSKSDLIVLCSGTASLEAAILGIPHIAVYRLSLPNYLLAKLMVKAKRFALANILLEDDIVPEFIQPNFSRVYLSIIGLLSNPAHILKQKLGQVKASLGSTGAALRIAQLTLK